MVLAGDSAATSPEGVESWIIGSLIVGLVQCVYQGTFCWNTALYKVNILKNQADQKRKKAVLNSSEKRGERRLFRAVETRSGRNGMDSGFTLARSLLFLEFFQRKIRFGCGQAHFFYFIQQVFDVGAQSAYVVSQAGLLVFELDFLFVQPLAFVAHIAQGNTLYGDGLFHA